MERIKNHWWNGKIYDPNGIILSNPDIWYPSLESWEETQKNMAKKKEAEAPRVEFSIPVKMGDYDKFMESIPDGYKKTVDTYRSLAIMHEVPARDGKTILEKINNTLNDWEQSDVYNGVEPTKGEIARYKLKYR